MASHRSWQTYQPTYRAEQIKKLADWVVAGASGSVVGLAGAGKSNLLGFVCHRPEVLQAHLPPHFGPIKLIPVDLNNLPSNNLATFYRVILRAFYEIRDRLEPVLEQTITNLYRENQAARDPFLPQSALRELLLEFQAQETRVVLVLDRFDRFCQTATPTMLDTLRGLRDSFKDTLCYIVGMRQEVVYLSDPLSLGEMYEILDTHVCWVGPMNDSDARQLLAQEMATALSPPDETEIAHLLALTGGYPALLKAACHWWLSLADKPVISRWSDALLAEQSIQSRLKELWTGLTQEEQQTLSEVQKSPDLREKRHHPVLTHLAVKGLCQQTDAGWRVFGDLFATFVANVEGRGGGKIRWDEKDDQVYQGQAPVGNLAPLERAVLTFLVKHPRLRHAKTDLIVATWPDELRRQGVTDDSLYQVIRELRKKIEPDPSRPCYIITWRGRPEGGYQFFPEGRPG